MDAEARLLSAGYSVSDIPGETNRMIHPEAPYFDYEDANFEVDKNDDEDIVTTIPPGPQMTMPTWGSTTRYSRGI